MVTTMPAVESIPPLLIAVQLITVTAAVICAVQAIIWIRDRIRRGRM